MVFYTAGSRPIDCLCCTSHTFILLQCKTPHVLVIIIAIVNIITIVVIIISSSSSSPALSACQGATCALSDSLQCYDTDSRWPTTRLELYNKPSKIYFLFSLTHHKAKNKPPRYIFKFGTHQSAKTKQQILQDTFSRARHWQASYPSVPPSLVV